MKDPDIYLYGVMFIISAYALKWRRAWQDQKKLTVWWTSRALDLQYKYEGDQFPKEDDGGDEVVSHEERLDGLNGEATKRLFAVLAAKEPVVPHELNKNLRLVSDERATCPRCRASVGLPTTTYVTQVESDRVLVQLNCGCGHGFTSWFSMR